MIDALVFSNKNSFFLGLTDECPIMPKPKLILEIDDDESEVIDEQGTDVNLEVVDVTNNANYEEVLVDESDQMMVAVLY